MLGVCSWSLRPADPSDLAAQVLATGCRAIQLHLDPLRTGAWSFDTAIATLHDAGMTIRSGMMSMAGEDYSTLDTIRETGGVRPDETWPTNLAAAEQNALVSQRLGLTLVTFHAGFMPHDASDPLRARLLDRLRALVDCFAARGVRVAFETGQESAETLAEALRDLNRPQAGVNFDPANMILYGMGDPVDALRRLAPYVLQLHIKDALPAPRPGVWGQEVTAGSGAVDWSALFSAYRSGGLNCDLMIEREAGAARAGDAAIARRLVLRYLPEMENA